MTNPPNFVLNEYMNHVLFLSGACSADVLLDGSPDFVRVAQTALAMNSLEKDHPGLRQFAQALVKAQRNLDRSSK